MARIRTIKPSFFTSEDITALILRTRLTFIGLWTYADDAGRGRANPKLIRAAVWPLDDVSDADVTNDLKALARTGLITLYKVDGTQYLQITGWAKHQRINRPSPSDFPPNPDSPTPPNPTIEDSLSPHGTVTEPSREERKGRERKGGEGNARASARPTPFCTNHPGGTDAPCTACGRARRAHDTWTPPPTPTPPALDELATADRCDHGEIIRNVDGHPACPLCRRAGLQQVIA